MSENQPKSKSNTDSGVALPAPTTVTDQSPASRVGSQSVLTLVGSTVFGIFLLVGIASGRAFWSSWYATWERGACSSAILIGIIVYGFLSNWKGELHRNRILISSLGLLAGLILSGIALSLGSENSLNAALSSFGIACILFAWGTGIARGEPILRSLYWSMFALLPLAFDTLFSAGFFVWVSQSAIALTTKLTDLAKLPYASEEGIVQFANGSADRFSSMGIWDSVILFASFAAMLGLLYRRCLPAVIASMILVVPLWISLRGLSWFLYACLIPNAASWGANETTRIVSEFGLGLSLVFALDHLMAQVFRPIPISQYNAEAPLLSYLWSWFCGLPEPILRIPKSHPIYLDWRVELKKKKIAPSFKTDRQWFWLELRYILSGPIAFLGATLDVIRGWVYSRQWRAILITCASVVLPALVLGVSLFARQGNSDTQVPTLSRESAALVSTQQLEEAVFRHAEEAFCEATNSETIMEPGTTAAPLESEKLRYIELLSRRILSIQPKDSEANYRLGLAYCLSGQPDKATTKMTELGDGYVGDFPKANAWLAKDMIIRKGKGEPIEMDAIIDRVEQGRKWKEIDYRLLVGRARIIEQKGQGAEAINVMKQAIASRPDLILELTNMYARQRHPDLAATAIQAESLFASRLNFPSEKESDRMAVASLQVLTKRFAEAEGILQEGLNRNEKSDRLRRELSEVQRIIYLDSVKELEDGKYIADLSLLEKVVNTDPLNPEISSEIAKLLPLKIRPTKTLLDALKKQVKLGLTSVAAHHMLAEAYYKFNSIKDAMTHWELALQGDPNSVGALNNLANCVTMIEPVDFERAIGLLEKAHQLDPTNVDVLDSFGYVLLLANRPKEAINKLELAISHDRNRVDCRKKLITAYDAVGMADMARFQTQLIQSLEQESAQKTQE